MDTSSHFQGVRFSLEGPLEMNVLPHCQLTWALGKSPAQQAPGLQQTVLQSLLHPTALMLWFCTDTTLIPRHAGQRTLSMKHWCSGGQLRDAAPWERPPHPLDSLSLTLPNSALRANESPVNELLYKSWHLLQ